MFKIFHYIFILIINFLFFAYSLFSIIFIFKKKNNFKKKNYWKKIDN